MNADRAADSNKKLFLAPMEGVTDWVMRDLLTSLGGIDHCVTEFLRITDHLMPESVFYKNCPELLAENSSQLSHTRSGTPVFIQLLGGKAQPMAENAARAVELGAIGIDLNFGCPAPTVNRHDGGASLLKSSERLFQIVQTVRKAVPADVPVTAKIRLGFDSPEACLENSKAIAEAGANWLTVHCRTKTDGYKPPAYWDWIPKIKKGCPIPLITNGEIWSAYDFNICKEQTDTFGYMMGRGAIRNPFLFNEISKKVLGTLSTQKPPSTFELVQRFYKQSELSVSSAFAVARTKGWLKQLSLSNSNLVAIFEQVKVIKIPKDFELTLFNLLEKESTNETNCKN